MPTRTWELALDGRTRRVEARCGYWSGQRIVRLDGTEVFRSRPKSFREQSDLWWYATEQIFQADGHAMTLRVRPAYWSQELSLVVDGRSAEDGLPVGRLRSPSYPPWGWTGTKISIASILLLIYLFLVIAPLGIYARTTGGPRWILAVNVLWDLWVPAAAFVLVVFAWQSQKRGRNVAMAASVFAASVIPIPIGFAEAADLLVPLDVEPLTFAGWEPGPADLRRIKLVDGPVVEFANDTGLHWRRYEPGEYVIVRGHFSRVIVDMRPAGP